MMKNAKRFSIPIIAQGILQKQYSQLGALPAELQRRSPQAHGKGEIPYTQEAIPLHRSNKSPTTEPGSEKA